MENMKWESIVLDVNEYLEAATDLEEGLAQVLRLNFREVYPSRVLQQVVHRNLAAYRKHVCGVVETAAIGYFNHDAIIGAVTFARGGVTYDSAEDYAKAVVKSTRAKLAKAFKAQTWDGTVDSLLNDSEE